MSESEAVLRAALKLRPRERARLLAEISSSLNGLGLGDEWEAEINRRIADLDAGRVKTLSRRTVAARIRRRLRG